MVVALIASVAVLVGALIIGFAVERRVGSDAKLEQLPWYFQLLVGGLATSPILFFEEQLTIGPIDGLVVAFAISCMCWIALPVVLSQLVDFDENRQARGC